jgi:hypothetical protein
MHFPNPRRARDRRVRHRAFTSVFVHPPQPPVFRYFLNSREYARTIGCTDHTIRMWRSQWLRTGHGPGAPPVRIDGSWRYRFDEITNAPEGETFLDLMRRDLADFIAGKHDNARARCAAA